MSLWRVILPFNCSSVGGITDFQIYQWYGSGIISITGTKQA